MSVNITVRGVPHDVRDALAEQAANRGQSLQAYLLALLKRESQFAQNAAILQTLDGELAAGTSEAESDGGTVTRSVVAALAQARAEREAQLNATLPNKA